MLIFISGMRLFDPQQVVLVYKCEQNSKKCTTEIVKNI